MTNTTFAPDAASLPADNRRSRTGPRHLVRETVARVRTHAARVARRRRAVKEYDDLLGLPDHVLRDMGVRRDDVHAARIRVLNAEKFKEAV